MTILRASDIPAHELDLLPIQGLRQQIEADRDDPSRPERELRWRLWRARVFSALQVRESRTRRGAC
jgi:hypothetical protein